MKTLSPEDYYTQNDKIVFTAAYHLKRGYCCGNRCLHCPYSKPHTKGNTTLENMKRALYLDDERTPTTVIPGYQPWEVVRNYDQFIEWILNNGIPDLISFDHDLAEEHVEDYFKQFMNKGHQIPDYENYNEKTGLDCARWLAKYIETNNLTLKTVTIHSFNPVGASNLQSFINGFKKHMGWEQDCCLIKHPFKKE